MSAFLPDAAAEGMHHDGEGGPVQPPAIVPMGTNSVRRIVAGQAVTDLASAVKELVDNALDAGATGINIRLWDSGAKILEVSDDGSGIPLESRPYVAFKNATSKIRSFEDIYGGAKTLGFRGEALFCLANISQQLLVCTRTVSDESGQRLVFGRDGYLDPESVCQAPRKVGTTVAVIGLFDALPVRKTDMIKRMKKQRAKLVKMMQGYAILCTGVRFNLMDMVGPANQERTFLATSMGNNSLEQTVSSVLGSRFLSGLTRFSVDLTNAIAEENTTESVWKVEGLVSKAPILTGRDGSSAREHQFFSINHRPVELPRISRALNDVWRTLEGSNNKRPACVLRFTLPNNAFDVNLSPDKRDIFLRDDAAVCELIREALTSLWASQSDGTFAANEVELLSQSQPQPNVEVAPPAEHAHSNGVPLETPRRKARRRMAFVHDLNNARMQHEGGGHMDSMQGTVLRDERGVASGQLESSSSASQGLEEVIASADAEEVVSGDVQVNQQTEGRLSHRALPSDRDQIRWSQTKLRFNKASTDEGQSQQDEINLLKETNDPLLSSQKDDEEAGSVMPEKQSPMETGRAVDEGPRDPPTSPANNNNAKCMGLEQFAFAPVGEDAQTVPPQARLKRKAASAELNEEALRELKRPTRTTPMSSSSMTTNAVTPALPHNEGGMIQVHVQSSTHRVTRAHKADEDIDDMECSGPESSPEESPVQPRKLQHHNPDADSMAEQESDSPNLVWDSFEGTDQIIEAAKFARLAMREQRRNLQSDVGTKAGSTSGSEIANIENVEDHNGTREKGIIGLTKDVFHDMEIIGQFNLGFILARCRNNHLWILDQHACDEKYNFENLCAKTVIHEQKLIAPMPLELSPSEESCILDNMYIFEQNGFRFSFDIKKPPRHRLALTSLPHSGAPDGRKAVQFGKEDVTALCSMLGADGESYAQAGGGYGTGADGSGLQGNNAVRRYAGGISHFDRSASQNCNETDDEKRARKIITRLPKAIAMFANRACRGSIMIGTPLSQKEMDAIVKKLGKVENPWNCPHGRPTMRHVRDLAPSLLQDHKQAEAHVVGPTLAVMSRFQDAEVNDGDDE